MFSVQERFIVDILVALAVAFRLPDWLEVPGPDFFEAAGFSVLSTLAVARRTCVGLFGVGRAASLVLSGGSLDISRLVSASKALPLPVDRADPNG